MSSREQNQSINYDDISMHFSDIDKAAKEEGLEFPINLFNINEQNASQICDKIKEDQENYEYNLKCLRYSLKIRPKQKKNIEQILVKLNEEVDKSFEEPKNYIKEVIINDDVSEFIKITSDYNFNPMENIKISSNNSTYNVSLMQLMAFYGSIKCFKYALLENKYNEKNISKYAVAGGNVEIIHLLEQNGVSFDNCFNVSIKYHREEISDWLLRNYKCELFDSKEIRNYYNMRAIYFFYKNGLLTEKEIFHIACEQSNITLIKYIFDTKNVDVDDKINYDLGCYDENEYGTQDYYINEKDYTELYIACQMENMDLIKCLVEYCHSDVEKISSRGFGVLHDYGNNPDYKNFYTKETPLHYASKKGLIDIVKYLIEIAGANKEVKDDKGRTPLQLALENNKNNVVAYLNKMKDK